jgi:hypothetical protein
MPRASMNPRPARWRRRGATLFLVLLWALVALSCTDGSPDRAGRAVGAWAGRAIAALPPPMTDAEALQRAPALPEDVIIQLMWAEDGYMYRIATDGRYLVTPVGGAEKQERPRPRAPLGAELVPEASRDRLLKVIADLPALPPVLPRMNVEGMFEPNHRVPIRLEPAVWSFRRGGVEERVLVWADSANSSTFGLLKPLYVALDEAAIGGWANE